MKPALDDLTRFRRLMKLGAGVLLLASAAWVRFYRLGGESLWHDEAFTWWFTRLPWMEMLDTVRLDGVNPPVYYLAVKPFLLFFGELEVALRILSALAGVLAVLVAWRLGDRVGGSVGGFAAGWFWAFHPMAIWFSRDARPYALAALLALVLLDLYLASRKNPSLSVWVGAFVVMALGQLTHYFFFLLGGVLVLISISQLREAPRLFRGWALTTLAAFLPLAGWIAWYFYQPNPSLGIGWIQQPVLMDPLLTLWNLVSGYGGVFTPATLLLGLVTLILSGFALVSEQEYKLARRVLVLALLLPVIAVWVLSQRRPVYIDRYFIVLLPFVSLLVAMGARAAIDRLAPYLLAGPDAYLPVGVLLVMLAFGNWLGWQVHLEPAYRNEDWRGLVATLTEGDGDPLPIWFSEPEASIPFQYYFRGELATLAGPEPPACESPCWWVMRQPYTATHAFSQAVTMASRPWEPVLPAACIGIPMGERSAGLLLWQISCVQGVK